MIRISSSFFFLTPLHWVYIHFSVNFLRWGLITFAHFSICQSGNPHLRLLKTKIKCPFVQQVSKTKPRALLPTTTKPGVSSRGITYYKQNNTFLVSFKWRCPLFCFLGQTSGPGSQQTSNPDYNAWVDFYRQPMAFFNQSAQQTPASGLQVRPDSWIWTNGCHTWFTAQMLEDWTGVGFLGVC